MHIDAWFATPIYNGEIVPTKEQKIKLKGISINTLKRMEIKSSSVTH